MFKFLKEKIGNWAKKISQSKEEEIEEIDISKEEKKKVKKEVKKTKKKEIKEPKKKTQKAPKIIEPEKEEQKIEEEKEEIEEKIEKPGFFGKLFKKITKIKITEEDFENYSEDLEMLLLENNVALEVADKMIKELKEKIVGKELLKKEIESEIRFSLRDIISEILIKPFDLIDAIKLKENKPYVILFCGVNGTGKTTTIAKIANHLKKKGISSLLAAADTFRAASIEQLKIHGEKIGVKVISHEYGSDPASVAFDAIEYAKKHKIDVVLIDTAGRMHTAKNLMAQIEKIAKVSKADTKLFIGESITGNDAIEQVKSFDEAIKIDGIILTKADIDEKGGTALSVGYITKKPILFLGTGQEYEKIEPFDKNRFIEKLGLEE